MTGRELAGIALRVWGVEVIAGALASLPSTLLFASITPAINVETAAIRASQVGQILDLLLRTALGAGLTLHADRIVGWVIPAGPPLRIDVYASELAALAFALVGLYLLVAGAADIMASIYTMATKPFWPMNSDGTFWYVWERERQAIVRGFVQVGAGTVLMLGRSALVNAWWWLRSAWKMPSGAQ